MEFIEKLYSGNPVGDLRLYCCGRRLDAPDHRFGPADRAHVWCIYLKEGCGTFEMSGHTHSIKKGDLFVAYPGRRISYRAARGSVWSIYWFSLDERGLLGADGCLTAFGITEDAPVVAVHDPLAMERTFESLLDEIPRNTTASAFACTALVYRLLSYIAPGERVHTASHNYIDEAIFFLTNHYDEPITVADCARVVGLDVSYFSRLFCRQTGMTPCAWLSTYRLDRAAALLSETDMKISEVSRTVGIADPLYFSRCFSKRFGCSPRAYAKTASSRGVEPYLYKHTTHSIKNK